MSVLDDFEAALKQEFEKLAESEYQTVKGALGKSYGEYKAAVTRDGEAFASDARAKLEAWTQQVAKGEISRDDFKELVEAEKSLASLETLEELGLGAVAIDRLRDGIVDAVVHTAFEVLL